MRNLKRALSLTLASVMLLGMMVVGAGAAGYKDITDDHNVEAIEVLQAVGAMVGDEAGNFDPDANVNRAQIATIMSRLLDLKVEDFNAADIPFTDVPEWAVPFVAACYADGITSGVSATAFGSSNNVTAAQAALMMMKALGYFQYQDDFGQDWQLATIKQASEIGLFYGVTVDRTSPLTRNDVAQMALNALKSNMVSFTGEVGSVYEVNGASIRVGYKPEYTIKTSADPIYNRIDNLATTIDKPTGQYEMQLGEYLYGGDLRLTSTTDVFGRPARYWEFNGEEVGTYMKEELLKSQYTTSVTGKTLYDLLGSSTINQYDVNVTIDGVSDPKVFDKFSPKSTNEYWPLFNKTHLNRNNDANVGATGNGVLTQVFVDTNDKTVYIAVINTYLAFANDDYDEKNELVDLDVYGITEISGHKDTFAKAKDKELFTVTSEEFNISDVADGDCFLVTVADGAIQSMKAPEVLSAVEISSFSKDSSLTTGGTKYDYASSLYYDPDTLERWTDGTNKINLKDITYDVYLDQYGYAIGVEEVEAPNNYLFITGVNGNYNNLANVNIEANAIFLDGTMETITINGRKSDWTDEVNNEDLNLTVDDGATVNRWFTYTKSSNGVYTVKLVNYGVDGLGQFHEDRDGTVNIIDYKKHNVKVDETNDRYATTIKNPQVVYSNDSTVFLTASLDQIETSAGNFSVVIDDVDSVAVGIDNVDITPWNHDYVTNMSGFAKSVAKHKNALCTAHPTATAGDNCNMSYGVYALYNSKGYILGMVVVGEDNGMSDNLVYIDSGDVKSESYDKATEKWTWVRNAIVNGERVELVEVNDSGVSLLENMDKNEWYRVRYNAEGHVTAVTAHNHTWGGACSCPDYDTYYNDWGLNGAGQNVPNPPYAYVTDYHNDAIYNAIVFPGVDVVLYHDVHIKVDPSNSGHTLYMTGDKDKASGIRYTEDTNIVFIQTERNKSYTEFWKGESGVKKALNALHELHKDSNDYSYEISALWKDGRATAIIIRDLNDQGQDGNWGNVRTGNVYFEATGGLDWAERDLAIYNEQAKITTLGKGRFYFELNSLSDELIGSDPLSFRYKVYVDEVKTNNQVGDEFTGTLNLLPGETTKYKAEVPELPHVFDPDEELFIVITEVLNGKRNIPVDVAEDMPSNIGTPSFETPSDDAKAGGALDNAYPGEKLTVTIPVTLGLGRAVGDLIEGDLEAGKPYYVEINGNKADPDPVYVAGGNLTVTYRITVKDIELGKLVVTGIYESEADGTETDPKPPVNQPIKTVTVTGLPTGTIKAGDKFTVKTTTANVSGEVEVTAVAPKTEITLKITTTHEAGFAADLAVTGWTVKVAEDGMSATLTKTVEVEAGDSGEVNEKYAPGTAEIPDASGNPKKIAVYYHGDAAPSVAEQIKAINDSEILEDTVVDIVDGKLYKNDEDGKLVEIIQTGTTPYTAVPTQVISVAFETADNIVAYALKGKATDVTVEGTSYKQGDVLVANGYAANASAGIEITSRVGTVETSVISSTDVLYQKGYQLTYGADVGSYKYSTKEITETEVGSSGTKSAYIADGLWLEVTGANTNEGKPVCLYVNGKEKEAATVGKTVVTYAPFQFKASTDADKDGVVKLEEKGGYELWIDGVKLDGSFDANDNQKLPATYDGKTFVLGYDATKLVLDGDDVDTVDAAAAVVDGAKVVTVDLSGATPKEGKIQIVTESEFNKSYSKVTFATDAEIVSFDLVNGKQEKNDVAVDTTSEVVFYVKTGSTLYVTTDNIAFSEAPSVDEDVMTVTVAGNDTTVETTEWVENTTYSAVFEYTVSAAEVSIDMTLTTAIS